MVMMIDGSRLIVSMGIVEMSHEEADEERYLYAPARPSRIRTACSSVQTSCMERVWPPPTLSRGLRSRKTIGPPCLSTSARLELELELPGR